MSDFSWLDALLPKTCAAREPPLSPLANNNLAGTEPKQFVRPSPQHLAVFVRGASLAPAALPTDPAERLLDESADSEGVPSSAGSRVSLFSPGKLFSRLSRRGRFSQRAPAAARPPATLPPTLPASPKT